MKWLEKLKKQLLNKNNVSVNDASLNFISDSSLYKIEIKQIKNVVIKQK